MPYPVADVVAAAGFLLLSYTPRPRNENKNVFSALLNKTFLSSLKGGGGGDT